MRARNVPAAVGFRESDRHSVRIRRLVAARIAPRGAIHIDEEISSEMRLQ
jgi:hypothetical protein